jgi:acetyl-CoA C-acetyltransferase
MRAASTAALRTANAHIDDVAYLDLYSCFGSSLHFACDALGISPFDARGLTVTGGLPYHGGPASGYLTHSIAAMVERLRADPGALGLVSGVGMHMTKHVYGCYSSEPAAVAVAPPPQIASPSETAVVAEYEGEATVAAYSVVHGRDGGPEWALLVCDLPGGTRTYARIEDAATCSRAEREELVGASVRLDTVNATGPMGEVRVNRAAW